MTPSPPSPSPVEAGPKVFHFSTGTVSAETYFVDGERHRVGGPAEKIYRADGSLLREAWYEHGELHRVGRPARVSFYADGSVCDEGYFFGGKVHRIGGPAQVEFRRDGTPVEPTYAFHGSRSKTHRSVVGELDELFPPALRDELTGSDYAPLLEEGHDPEAILDVLRAGVVSVDSVREVFGGAPVEWVRSFEEGRS